MFQTILFAILQGLTEFFPISSSGHLVVFKHVMPGMERWIESIELEVAVHLGTTIAVMMFFSAETREILGQFQHMARLALMNLATRNVKLGKFSAGREVSLATGVLAGSVPTAVIALLFGGVFERMFSSVGGVGVAFAITGTFLWATRWFDPTCLPANPRRRPLTLVSALIIGAVQGMAIIPGISRSGSTITAGLLLRLNPETAGKFSFLLSIPAILAACLMKIGHGLAFDADRMNQLVAGTAAAAVVGYACLWGLMSLIKRGHFYYFAYYCWVAAALTLLATCV